MAIITTMIQYELSHDQFDTLFDLYLLDDDESLSIDSFICNFANAIDCIKIGDIMTLYFKSNNHLNIFLLKLPQ